MQRLAFILVLWLLNLVIFVEYLSHNVPHKVDSSGQKSLNTKKGVVRALAVANLSVMFYFLFLWTVSRGVLFFHPESKNEKSLMLLVWNGVIVNAADIFNRVFVFPLTFVIFYSLLLLKQEIQMLNKVLNKMLNLFNGDSTSLVSKFLEMISDNVREILYSIHVELPLQMCLPCRQDRMRFLYHDKSYKRPEYFVLELRCRSNTGRNTSNGNSCWESIIDSIKFSIWYLIGTLIYFFFLCHVVGSSFDKFSIFTWGFGILILTAIKQLSTCFCHGGSREGEDTARSAQVIGIVTENFLFLSFLTTFAIVMLLCLAILIHIASTFYLNTATRIMMSMTTKFRLCLVSYAFGVYLVPVNWKFDAIKDAVKACLRGDYYDVNFATITVFVSIVVHSYFNFENSVYSIPAFFFGFTLRTFDESSGIISSTIGHALFFVLLGVMRADLDFSQSWMWWCKDISSWVVERYPLLGFDFDYFSALSSILFRSWFVLAPPFFAAKYLATPALIADVSMLFFVVAPVLIYFTVVPAEDSPVWEGYSVFNLPPFLWLPFVFSSAFLNLCWDMVVDSYGNFERLVALVSPKNVSADGGLQYAVERQKRCLRVILRLVVFLDLLFAAQFPIMLHEAVSPKLNVTNATDSFKIFSLSLGRNRTGACHGIEHGSIKSSGVCSLNWHGLTVLDHAILSQTAYVNAFTRESSLINAGLSLSEFSNRSNEANCIFAEFYAGNISAGDSLDRLLSLPEFSNSKASKTILELLKRLRNKDTNTNQYKHFLRKALKFVFPEDLYGNVTLNDNVRQPKLHHIDFHNHKHTVIVIQGTDPDHIEDILADGVLFISSAVMDIATLFLPPLNWINARFRMDIQWCIHWLQQQFSPDVASSQIYAYRPVVKYVYALLNKTARHEIYNTYVQESQSRSRYLYGNTVNSPIIQRIEKKRLSKWLSNLIPDRRYRTGHASCPDHDHDCWTISITGHSLGGGIASIVGATLGIQSVSFSGPGMMFAKHQYETPIGNNTLYPNLAHASELATTIVPSHDLVPQVDRHLGNVLHTVCSSTDPLSCHKIDAMICHLMSHCGDNQDGKRFQSCNASYKIIRNKTRLERLFMGLFDE